MAIPRYGIGNNRQWIKQEGLFPVQSSVLDEEELLTWVMKDYYHLDPTSCRFLSRGDSDIYRVKTSTSNYYLKVYRPPKSIESVEAEAAFVSALSQSGIEVVKPVPRSNGQYAHQASAPEGLRPMLLYEEAPPPLPQELDAGILAQIGEKVALLHEVADKMGTSLDISPIDLEKNHQENVFFTSQFLSDVESEYFEEVSFQLVKFLEKQSRNSPDFGLCHADLVLSNIRLGEAGMITFFDFGNALRIWRAYELAVVYWSLMNRYMEDGEKLWEAFLKGYQSNRPLPGLVSEYITEFLVLRQIVFLGGNCASLPLRLGTEPFESGFIEDQMERLRHLVQDLSFDLPSRSSRSQAFKLPIQNSTITTGTNQ
jgi:Ser/Thr protein kinase RdoA (MazF antagonist)